MKLETSTRGAREPDRITYNTLNDSRYRELQKAEYPNRLSYTERARGGKAETWGATPIADRIRPMRTHRMDSSRWGIRGAHPSVHLQTAEWYRVCFRFASRMRKGGGVAEERPPRDTARSPKRKSSGMIALVEGRAAGIHALGLRGLLRR